MPIPVVEEYEIANGEYKSSFSFKIATSAGVIWDVAYPTRCTITKMKTNAWITYYVDHKQAMTLFDNLNENDEEEYNLSILSKNGDVFCTMDKFRMESVSIMKDVVEFHAQTDNIAYTASPTAVQGPTTNQGLEKCHWCGTPTKKVGGVTFRTVYDVCPKCMK